MVTIRSLNKDDVHPIAAAFTDLGWDKPASQFEGYLAEQLADQRVVLVATVDEVFAGYVTVVWESGYAPFKDTGIPEIVDFNVLPKYRRKRIGTQLMDEAEKRAAKRSTVVGIGVGLTEDYGAAHLLYLKRGYIPNGRGVSYAGKVCRYGDQVTIDDALAIHFTKRSA